VELLGITPEVPDSMKGIDERKGKSQELPANYKTFKEYLTDNLKSGV